MINNYIYTCESMHKFIQLNFKLAKNIIRYTHACLCIYARTFCIEISDKLHGLHRIIIRLMKRGFTCSFCTKYFTDQFV